MLYVQFGVHYDVIDHPKTSPIHNVLGTVHKTYPNNTTSLGILFKSLPFTERVVQCQLD